MCDLLQFLSTEKMETGIERMKTDDEMSVSLLL